MNVLVAIPGEEIQVVQIPEGVKAISQMVGGPLECIQLGDDFILYCNQNGNEQDLPVNPHFSQGIIKGNFIIAKKQSDGPLLGLDSEEISLIEKKFIRNHAGE